MRDISSSGEIFSACPSMFRMRRCLREGSAAPCTSSMEALYRPSLSARIFAERISACAARGLAPYRTYLRMKSGASADCGWVERTSFAAARRTFSDAGTVWIICENSRTLSRPATACNLVASSPVVRVSIDSKSASTGNGTRSLYRNRSSCASGNG